MKSLGLTVISAALLLNFSSAFAQSAPPGGNSQTIAKRGLNLVGSGLRKAWNGARAVGIAASNYRLHGTGAPLSSSQMNPYQSMQQPLQMQPMQMQPIQPLQMRFPTTSTGNILGGQNIYNGDGTITTTSKNIFGGQNAMLPGGGMVTTMPNVFGGYNAYGPDGSMTTSMSNVFGGQNIYHQNGSMTTTVPNVFGGQNIYGANGNFSQTMPNLMGGYNTLP